MNVSRAAGMFAVLVSALCGCSTFGASAEATEDAGDASSNVPVSDAGNAEASAEASADASALPTSCKDLLAKNPTRTGKDGFYDITGGADGGPSRHVYCDLTTDGGGWTLVGRSSPTAVTHPLGWKTASGDVESTSEAYALDVTSTAITFSEVLVGDNAPGTQGVSTRAYKLGVDAAFLGLKLATVSSGNVVTVLGDCSPSGGGPQMLQNTGAPDLTDGFYFRDVPGTDNHRGLHVNGFDLANRPDCAQGGLLDKLQGVVFVR